MDFDAWLLPGELLVVLNCKRLSVISGRFFLNLLPHPAFGNF
jgi:hypothetical protein